MNESTQLLSDVTVYLKYARYIPKLKRRETWEEIVDRYLSMHLGKYCNQRAVSMFESWCTNGRDFESINDYFEDELAREIVTKGQLIYDRRVLMSMRAAQFAGTAMMRNNARGYNCAYLPIDDYRAFSELFFLLLGGSGVGYSVQRHHVNKLPEISRPTGDYKFLVADNIEGWGDAVKALMGSYLGKRKTKPRFDFSDIRPKGTQLVTSGGKAPGPGPLREALAKIESILDDKQNGEKLTPLECSDICCIMADAVLAGGIRRAALIALFSFDDDEMRHSKYGHDWMETKSYRFRANISAVVLRHRVTKRAFQDAWKITSSAGTGEFGYFFTNDKDWGTNPCAEIALRAMQFCNLVEINAGEIFSVQDFMEVCEAASFFGTLQAGYTDFHYLRKEWKETTEKDALIGVGITGICNGSLLNLIDEFDRDSGFSLLRQGAQRVLDVNTEVAHRIGINPSARCTTIKPSGTTSCVLGTSSGIHAWHSPHYIRNMQCAVGDSLYNFMSNEHPDLVKPMDQSPKDAVVGIPIKAPAGAILRENETALGVAERVRKFNLEWVRSGHRSGDNYHNVSCTINAKPDEFEPLGEWMWAHRDDFTAMSVFPYDGGHYKDAPFMECTEEEYQAKLDYIREKPIDLTKIIEDEDSTDLTGEIACQGAACEITY